MRSIHNLAYVPLWNLKDDPSRPRRPGDRVAASTILSATRRRNPQAKKSITLAKFFTDGFPSTAAWAKARRRASFITKPPLISVTKIAIASCNVLAIA